MPSARIKNLSVPQLLAMRVDIDKQRQSRKAELQAQLAQIGGDSNGSKVRSVKGSKVPPKYKHPQTGETWSGRGGGAGVACQGNQKRKEAGRLSDRQAREKETREIILPGTFCPYGFGYEPAPAAYAPIFPFLMISGHIVREY